MSTITIIITITIINANECHHQDPFHPESANRLLLLIDLLSVGSHRQHIFSCVIYILPGAWYQFTSAFKIKPHIGNNASANWVSTGDCLRILLSRSHFHENPLIILKILIILVILLFSVLHENSILPLRVKSAHNCELLTGRALKLGDAAAAAAG